MEKLIQDHAENKFLKYVDKLNRRAVKMGCAPLVATKVGEKLVLDDDLYQSSGKMIEYFHLFYVYEITGETPVINGWEFIGRLEHDSLLGTVVRVAPGKEVPKKYWDADCVCDHCNTKRQRKDTFVLREVASGEYKQIGRQCVRDFIGYDNPADMYWWVAIMDDVSTEVDSYNVIRELPLVGVVDTLKLTAACSKEWGYVSRKMAEERDMSSTTNNVAHLYFSRMLKEYERSVITSAFSGDYDKIAGEVIAWVKSWTPDMIQQSEFNHNVHKFVSADYVRSNMLGYITCLPTLYAKAMGQLKAKVAKSNEFLGAVGDKITAKVKVVNIIHMQGSFGMTSLVMMEDESGNSVKWFSSANPTVNVEDVVTVKGTVKNHSNYKGTNQTMLTRCKFI